MRYTIVVPAYNEGARLRKTLGSLKEHMGNAQLMVVDDGSRDDTSQVAKEEGAVVKLHTVNKGKGAAIKTGLSEAAGDIVGFVDADGSTSPMHVRKVFDRVGECDIAIASRRLKESVLPVDQPPHRKISGILLRLLTKYLLGLDFQDTQCGCKAMRREIAHDMMPRIKSDGFEFDIELLYLANRMGYVVCEVPVEWTDDADSKVNPLMDGARMMRLILALRLGLKR